MSVIVSEVDKFICQCWVWLISCINVNTKENSAHLFSPWVNRVPYCLLLCLLGVVNICVKKWRNHRKVSIWWVLISKTRSLLILQHFISDFTDMGPFVVFLRAVILTSFNLWKLYRDIKSIEMENTVFYCFYSYLLILCNCSGIWGALCGATQSQKKEKWTECDKTF